MNRLTGPKLRTVSKCFYNNTKKRGKNHHARRHNRCDYLAGPCSTIFDTIDQHRQDRQHQRQRQRRQQQMLLHPQFHHEGVLPQNVGRPCCHHRFIHCFGIGSSTNGSSHGSPLSSSAASTITRSIIHCQQNQTIRSLSMTAWLPDAVQQFSIWGGTGVVLQALHGNAGMPYWACFGAMNFILRASLVPLVIYSAKTAARFAKVAPEIQFIVTLFQNDLKKMRAEGKSLTEQRYLFLQNLQTVRGIYKLHDINPLTVFLSPLLQIPFFYYVAVDLRKIVNGADPELAQELTESSFLWVHDLTDPDPWYGLPIAAGAMLYTNVEVAIGRQSLSGPTASKSDFARLLKDLFQTLAVFMPCFASQSPAGLQIYLVSSFTWTLFQSAALRNDTMRSWIGLPSMGSPPTEPKYAKEFMEFKKLEQKAKEIRGDGPVLGRNVLAVGFETSFPGTDRPSTIKGSDIKPVGDDEEDGLDSMSENGLDSNGSLPATPKISMSQASAAWGGQFIHGISAPMHELEERMMDEMKAQKAKELATQKLLSEREQYMAQPSEDAMKAANLGVVIPKNTTDTKPQARSSSSSSSESAGEGTLTLNTAKFKRAKGKTTKKRGSGPGKKR